MMPAYKSWMQSLPPSITQKNYLIRIQYRLINDLLSDSYSSNQRVIALSINKGNVLHFISSVTLTIEEFGIPGHQGVIYCSDDLENFYLRVS